MSDQPVLNAELQIVTPVFCAGADPNGVSEIRPFSLRGALRWWYRAIDGDFAKWEPFVFGATTGTGHSSPVALQVRRWVQDTESLKKQLTPKKQLTLQPAQGSGAAYLGYTFYLSKNHRKAIRPERGIVPLRLAWQWQPRERQDQERVRRAWAASLWLFGHLGGLGSRSRRGYGTLALTRWSGWEECAHLPPAHGAASAQEWKQRLQHGWKKIRQWFHPPTDAEHQHLGRDLNVWLWKEGFASWHEALDDVGGLLQTFRKRAEIHKPEILAAFGLPIQFRNHSPKRVSPEGYNRAASLLQIRVIQINGKYHPLVWRADGPLVPSQKPPKLKYEGNYSEQRQPPTDWDRALNQFLKKIQDSCV
jgi:CRISPR-associated protein Cmr1